jgi:hypothetical protein
MRTTERRTGQRSRSNGLTSGIVGSLLQAGLSTLREQASTEAQQLTQLIREQGDHYLQKRKSRAADELTRIGDAVQLTADKLHEENIDALAEYVDSAAESFERAAQFLEQRNLKDLGRDLERLARRQPAVVLGALFVGGFALGRFVKSGLSQE